MRPRSPSPLPRRARCRSRLTLRLRLWLLLVRRCRRRFRSCSLRCDRVPPLRCRIFNPIDATLLGRRCRRRCDAAMSFLSSSAEVPGSRLSLLSSSAWLSFLSSSAAGLATVVPGSWLPSVSTAPLPGSAGECRSSRCVSFLSSSAAGLATAVPPLWSVPVAVAAAAGLATAVPPLWSVPVAGCGGGGGGGSGWPPAWSGCGKVVSSLN